MEATISHLRVFAPLSRTREGGREVGRRERKGRGEKFNSSRRNAARLETGPRQMPGLSAVGRAGWQSRWILALSPLGERWAGPYWFISTNRSSSFISLWSLFRKALVTDWNPLVLRYVLPKFKHKCFSKKEGISIRSEACSEISHCAHSLE